MKYYTKAITGDVLFNRSKNSPAKGYVESLNEFYRENKDMIIVDITHFSENNDYYGLVTYYKKGENK